MPARYDSYDKEWAKRRKYISDLEKAIQIYSENLPSTAVMDLLKKELARAKKAFEKFVNKNEF